MKFFKYKNKIHPLIAFVIAIFILVYGLIFARHQYSIIYFAAVYLFCFLFGCHFTCLKVLPMIVIVGGIFGVLTYYVYQDIESTLAMITRFLALFTSLAILLTVDTVRMTRALSSIKLSRTITLGMLIALSFIPVLNKELKKVKEAMKTRGAGSLFNPKVFYRALFIPFVTRIVSISDSLSLSIETRGFKLGKVKYSIYKREYLTIYDLIFLSFIVAGGVLLVVL